MSKPCKDFLPKNYSERLLAIEDIAHRALQAYGLPRAFERDDFREGAVVNRTEYHFNLSNNDSMWCVLPQKIVHERLVVYGLIPESAVIMKVRGIKDMYYEADKKMRITVKNGKTEYYFRDESSNKPRWTQFRLSEQEYYTYILCHDDVYAPYSEQVDLLSRKLQPNPQIRSSHGIDDAIVALKQSKRPSLAPGSIDLKAA